MRSPRCLALLGAAAASAAAGATPGGLRKYDASRQQLFGSEESRRFDAEARARLSSGERRLNEHLLRLKAADTAPARIDDPTANPFAPFHKTRERMRESPLFQLLARAPKGAALHAHTGGLIDGKWVVDFVVRSADSYIYRGQESAAGADSHKEGKDAPQTMTDDAPVKGSLAFFNTTVGNEMESKGWVNIYIERNISLGGNIALQAEYDAAIYDNITLDDVAGLSVDAVWVRMMDCFNRLAGALGYVEAFRANIAEAADRFAADGILYLEIRGYFGPGGAIFDIAGGEQLSLGEIIALMKEESDKAVERWAGRGIDGGHGFLGIKVIICGQKRDTRASVRALLQETEALLAAFPGFVVGFDLVGQEDPSQYNPVHSLYHFHDVLLEFEGRVPYFMHAGETLRWPEGEPGSSPYTVEAGSRPGIRNGTSTGPPTTGAAEGFAGNGANTNVQDAILLRTKRIGHGYALAGHPELAKRLAKLKRIAVEICPLSNQVLRLVDDLRNHAGGMLATAGVPMVLSPDDPGIYRYDGITPDFYSAVIAFPGFDLASVYQLAANSILYSAMSEPERKMAFQTFLPQWNSFVAKEVKALDDEGPNAIFA